MKKNKPGSLHTPLLDKNTGIDSSSGSNALTTEASDRQSAAHSSSSASTKRESIISPHSTDNLLSGVTSEPVQENGISISTPRTFQNQKPYNDEKRLSTIMQLAKHESKEEEGVLKGILFSSPFLLAAIEGNVVNLKTLLGENMTTLQKMTQKTKIADISERLIYNPDSTDGPTALGLAAYHGHYSAVVYLFNYQWDKGKKSFFKNNDLYKSIAMLLKHPILNNSHHNEPEKEKQVVNLMNIAYFLIGHAIHLIHSFQSAKFTSQEKVLLEELLNEKNYQTNQHIPLLKKFVLNYFKEIPALDVKSDETLFYDPTTEKFSVEDSIDGIAEEVKEDNLANNRLTRERSISNNFGYQSMSKSRLPLTAVVDNKIKAVQENLLSNIPQDGHGIPQLRASIANAKNMDDIREALGTAANEAVKAVQKYLLPKINLMRGHNIPQLKLAIENAKSMDDIRAALGKAADEAIVLQALRYQDMIKNWLTELHTAGLMEKTDLQQLTRLAAKIKTTADDEDAFETIKPVLIEMIDNPVLENKKKEKVVLINQDELRTAIEGAENLKAIKRILFYSFENDGASAASRAGFGIKGELKLSTHQEFINQCFTKIANLEALTTTLGSIGLLTASDMSPQTKSMPNNRNSRTSSAAVRTSSISVRTSSAINPQALTSSASVRSPFTTNPQSLAPSASVRSPFTTNPQALASSTSVRTSIATNKQTLVAKNAAAERKRTTISYVGSGAGQNNLSIRSINSDTLTN